MGRADLGAASVEISFAEFGGPDRGSGLRVPERWDSRDLGGGLQSAAG